MASEKMDAPVSTAAVSPRTAGTRAMTSLASSPPLERSGRPTEASLEAELARERHVALELQRAILPLHDEPFDLPGLRTVVRYLPASKASVGGDWYINAQLAAQRGLRA